MDKYWQIFSQILTNILPNIDKYFSKYWQIFFQILTNILPNIDKYSSKYSHPVNSSDDKLVFWLFPPACSGNTAGWPFAPGNIPHFIVHGFSLFFSQIFSAHWQILNILSQIFSTHLSTICHLRKYSTCYGDFTTWCYSKFFISSQFKTNIDSAHNSPLKSGCAESDMKRILVTNRSAEIWIQTITTTSNSNFWISRQSSIRWKDFLFSFYPIIPLLVKRRHG